MFQFPRCPPDRLYIQRPVTGLPACRVAPFGSGRLIARLQLPVHVSPLSASFFGSTPLRHPPNTLSSLALYCVLSIHIRACAQTCTHHTNSQALRDPRLGLSCTDRPTPSKRGPNRPACQSYCSLASAKLKQIYMTTYIPFPQTISHKRRHARTSSYREANDVAMSPHRYAVVHVHLVIFFHGKITCRPLHRKFRRGRPPKYITIGVVCQDIF